MTTTSDILGSTVELSEWHVLPAGFQQGKFPFFFYPMVEADKYPKPVGGMQSAALKTFKCYKMPVQAGNAESIASANCLRQYVPEESWRYLLCIISTMRVYFTVKSPRNSKAGDCRVNRAEGIAYITINSMENKYKFLCVVLHELSHVLNHIHYTAHDVCWQAIYSCLLANFYRYFPREYRYELIWGIGKTPASSSDSNFDGMAVLFGLREYPSEAYCRWSIEQLQKIEPADCDVARIPTLPNSEIKNDHRNILERDGGGGGYVAHIRPEQIAPDNLPYNFTYSKEGFCYSYEAHQKYTGRLLIPIDISASDRFLHLVDKMPYRARSAVMQIYGLIHGIGALRYAERTWSSWMSGRVSGWAPSRFFDIAPLVFPLDRKRELCKLIIDYTDEISAQQRRYPVSRDWETILSYNVFITKRTDIERMVSDYADGNVRTFDYESRYGFMNHKDIVWLAQNDMVEYRKELSSKKRNELMSSLAQFPVALDAMLSEYRIRGLGCATIAFPDRVYTVRIVSPLRALFRRIAVGLGFSKDFVLSHSSNLGS